MDIHGGLITNSNDPNFLTPFYIHAICLCPRIQIWDLGM